MGGSLGVRQPGCEARPCRVCTHLLVSDLHLVSLHVEGFSDLLLQLLVPVLLLPLLHLPQ